VDGAGEGFIGGRHDGPVADDEEPFFDESPGDGLPCAGEYACKSRAGNTHPSGGGFLVEPFEIREAQCLEFVMPQDLDLELTDRQADGFETPSSGLASDLSEFLGSSHFAS
jgi:hypothetical protein